MSLILLFVLFEGAAIVFSVLAHVPLKGGWWHLSDVCHAGAVVVAWEGVVRPLWQRWGLL